MLMLSTAAAFAAVIHHVQANLKEWIHQQQHLPEADGELSELLVTDIHKPSNSTQYSYTASLCQYMTVGILAVVAAAAYYSSCSIC